MSLKRLTERTSAPFTGCRVNREAGTITGVLICGTQSANGRDYPAEVLRRDHAMYEGRPVNCDHGREATVDRRLGWFSGVAPGDDGRPRGTLNLLKSHPVYERVMEAAEKNPALFGLSHVAMCETRRSREGREIVEAIKSVESIDLVADPATTKSLFEAVGDSSSKNQAGQRRAMYAKDPDDHVTSTKLASKKSKKKKRKRESTGDTNVGFTIKQLAGWVARHAESKTTQILAVKRLAEMDDMADVPALDAEPSAETDPADGVKDAFHSAIMHLVQQALDGELDPKDALGKIKKLIASHGEMSDSGDDEDAGDDDGDTDKDDTDIDESKKGRTAAPGMKSLREAQSACVAAGYTNPSLDDVELVAATAADRRPAIIARLQRTTEGAGAERPTSAGRSPGGTAAGRKLTESKAPADAKSFAASLRE